MNVWHYHIASGLLYLGFSDREPVQCYSGKGKCIDEPTCTSVKGEGPIPIGVYRCLAPRDHPSLGPVAIPLEPQAANKMFGRSGFYVHGDNRFGDRSASSGCIIAGRGVRSLFNAGDLVCVFPY